MRLLYWFFAAVLFSLMSSVAVADDIKVSSDGATARKITVKVENGTRGLFGRLMNRDRGSAATGGAKVAPRIQIPATVVIPALVVPTAAPTELPKPGTVIDVHSQK